MDCFTENVIREMDLEVGKQEIAETTQEYYRIYCASTNKGYFKNNGFFVDFSLLKRVIIRPKIIWR